MRDAFDRTTFFGIKLTVEEALARLALDDPMEMRLEMIPNNGVTEIETIERAWCVERIQKNTPFESGETAQDMDFGLHVHVTVANKKKPSAPHGLGRLFFKTKPECRLTREQLDESLKRGHGAALFSGEPNERTDGATKSGASKAEGGGGGD